MAAVLRMQKCRNALEYELGVINEMGFDAYFLITWDLCRHATDLGIWYNARGSAAGSLVAYTLDITNVEPLGHGLIFERFLNPARVNMPDIDLDFQDDRRADIMQYCADKYGADRVSQIITFGTLGAKAAIRDVGRVKDIPLSEVDRVAKLIPGNPGMTIEKAFEQSPELKEMYETYDYLHDLLDTAQQMEGAIRNAGTHACGVIITDIPITKYAPLHRPTSNSDDSPIKAVAQFEMAVVDALGLLKVDFLGLSTLTIMQRACALIEERHGIRYNLENIPLDDPETFKFMGEGHTAGVFQLEGSGMTRYLMQMKPQNLDNIIAMVALYRPGPLGFIPDYIHRMHGEEKVVYAHPKLEPIFNETYGIPIYQEQIMFAAMDLANYTASEADGLRKAIAKKKKKDIEMHRNKFIEGAVENDIERKIATQIFVDWENFARYGFNKSHAADYGVIAVETAYLKAHFTVEYMTALLSASKNDSGKVAFYAADCQSMGIEVLPPDINHSDWDFSIEDRDGGSAVIRFGMGAVKNVGHGPVETILNARADGPFKDLAELVNRVDMRHVGKRALESLIRVGALDAFGPRSALLMIMENLISLSTSYFKAAESGQMSFFGEVVGVQDEIRLPIVDIIDQREQLEWEKELLGLYVSDHPLSPYMGLLKSKVTHFLGQLGEVGNKKPVTVAGMVVRMRRHQTKKGDPMAFATIEDIQGTLDLVIFPRTWAQFNGLIQVDNLILVRGKVDADGSDPKVLADHIELISLDEVDVSMLEALPQDALLEMPAAVDLLPMPPVPAELNGFNVEAEPDFEDVDEEDEDEPQLRTTPACHMTHDETPADEPVRYQAPAAAPQPNPARQVTEADDPFGEGPPMPDDWIIAPRPECRNGATPAEPQARAQAEPVFSAPLSEQVKAVQTETTVAVQERPSEAVVEAVPSPVAPPAKEVKLPPYIVPPDEAQRNIVLPNGSAASGLNIDLRPKKNGDKPRMVTVILHPCGDKVRDQRRLQRLHGLLRSCPGLDRFSLMIHESGHDYLVEFPNNTTGISTEMLRKLSEIIGEENVRVTPLKA